MIVMAVVAVACAMARTERTRFAALAGLASGLGLAIGIEALAFHALAGASFALSAAVDRDEAKPARAYGLTLAAASLGFFALQTPPDRWGLSVCDALGANLVGAILVAGLGLAAFATWGARFGLMARLAQLAAIGARRGGGLYRRQPRLSARAVRGRRSASSPDLVRPHQ